MSTSTAAEAYKRELNINLSLVFEPGSKIHGRRMDAIRDEVEEALQKVVSEQLPTAVADVTSQMDWRYVFKQEHVHFRVGEDEDDEESIVRKAAEEDEISD